MRSLNSLAVALLLAGAATALAQAPPDLAAAMKLAGEARTKALVDGAKKESGAVMVYHSTQTDDLQPVFDAFTKKYGIKVVDWRSSSENVVQRIIGETRAAKRDVDFIENNSPEMEALRREKVLMRIETPYYSDMRPGTLGAHHEYATSTMDIFVQAYNTEKVKPEELPRTFQDLADPRFHDKLAIEAEDFAWFGTLLHDLGEAQGVKLFTDIVHANGMSVRKGHTLLANLVASGEVPIGLTVYNYKPTQLKKKGAKIDSIVLRPAIAQLHAVAVVAKSTRPFSAVLLYDFFLSEGQPILAAKDFVPSSRKVPSPYGDMPIRFIDPVESLERQDAWQKQYDAIFLKRSR
jgi:iron(III) transport system substrate-binding protein